MNTAYVLGHAEDGALVQLLERAGFFTQPAENADAAAEMLGGVCADAFVIDVGDAEVDGERLLERLQKAGARRDVPIVVTGAHRAQFRRLARCRSIAAVVPALGHSGDVVLTAARRPIPRHNVPPFAGGNLPRAFQGNSGIFRGRGVCDFSVSRQIGDRRYWAIAMALTIALTVLLVTAVSALHFEMLRLLYFELPRVPLAGRLAGKHRVGLGVAGAMIAHTLEIVLFGLGYWAALSIHPGGLTGAFDGSLWSCVYYAAVTYTSLGLGDIAPVSGMQFMTGMTALTGLVLIAWTASFTFLLMQRYWGER